MHWFKLVLIVCLFSLPAFADVDFETPQVQSAAFDDVKFSVTTQNYKVTFSPGVYSWGTRMFAKYETSNLNHLEDYAVVQFVKGCQFNNRYENGKIVYYDNIFRYLFNEAVPYKLKDWTIDSGDSDPMFGNTPDDFDYEGAKKTRHALYMWNRFDNFDQNGEVLYYKEKPTKPYLYTDDHPGTAFFQNGMAKNISLEYRTCLYKTSDIPLKAKPSDIDFGKAVQCFGWNSSFIYDHIKNTFSRPAGLDNHCLR